MAMSIGCSETVVSAFTEEQAARLTGVSKAQLRHWDRTGFFRPAFASEDRRVAYGRLYSFKDIVSLRVIHTLRNRHRVPLQHLRKVRDTLAHLEDDKWTATELYVFNRRVVFVEPGTDACREVVSGQYVVGLALGSEADAAEKAVHDLNQRSPSEIGQMARSRYINHNATVIAGTRIPVSTIKHYHEDGFAIDEILAEFPSLSRQDVVAAIEYSGDNKAA